MNFENKVFLKIEERTLPATFILWIKEIQEEDGCHCLIWTWKLLQILPQRIMRVPVPDNIYLNMLTCWKQEMRSVLELCCKMTQSQEKQGSSAKTPMQTPSHSGLKVYMELMAFTKHSKYAAVYRLLALIFYAYNVLLVARVCEPTGNCYFLHTALQTKRTKSNLTFLYSAANHSSDISKLTIS